MANKTIFDIAKEANVSTATVSRVINNNGPVKEKTKKKVMAIIDKYGFVPSTAARTLSHRQSRAIGVLIPNLTTTKFHHQKASAHPYFP